MPNSNGADGSGINTAERQGEWLFAKHAMCGADGRIILVASISRDFNAPGKKADGLPAPASVLDFIQGHFGKNTRIEEVAKCRISAYPIEDGMSGSFSKLVRSSSSLRSASTRPRSCCGGHPTLSARSGENAMQVGVPLQGVVSLGIVIPWRCHGLPMNCPSRGIRFTLN